MSRKILAYGAVSGKTLIELITRVREAIEAGAEPLGGITFLGYTRKCQNKRSSFSREDVARDIARDFEIENPFIQTMVEYADVDDTTIKENEKSAATSAKHIIKCDSCGYDHLTFTGVVDGAVQLHCSNCDRNTYIPTVKNEEKVVEHTPQRRIECPKCHCTETMAFVGSKNGLSWVKCPRCETEFGFLGLHDPK